VVDVGRVAVAQAAALAALLGGPVGQGTGGQDIAPGGLGSAGAHAIVQGTVDHDLPKLEKAVLLRHA